MTGDDLTDRWHAAVCRELESRVKNRDFWVWVTVEPGAEATPPDNLAPEAWQGFAEKAANWLGGFSAEKVDPDDPPKHEAEVAGTRVELSATPKKPNRRGSDPLILNLYPGMTYFTGSYSAGPAPELPEEDSDNSP